MIDLARFRPILAGLTAATGLALALSAASAPAIAQTTTQAAPAAAAPAPAQGTVPVVIGILDTETIVLGSSAGKSLTAQANAALKALQDATQKQGDALVLKAKALEAQRAANPPIAPADYAAQRQALAVQDDKIRSSFDQNKEALDARVDKARTNLLAAATKVIQDIAKQRGLTLIISRNSAPLFPEQWNITNDVLARLNKSLPTIKM